MSRNIKGGFLMAGCWCFVCSIAWCGENGVKECGILVSSAGIIDSTGAWGCSHQIYYSFSFSESLLRIHS